MSPLIDDFSCGSLVKKMDAANGKVNQRAA